MLQKKVSLKKKSKCFRSKWGINILKKPFSFWQNVVFTDETRVRISSDGIVRIFRRNGTRFLEKFDFGQTITYVLGCNTIRWTEIACLVSKQAKRCRWFGNFENLRRKNAFPGPFFFSKIMLLCISRKISAVSSKKTSGRYWNGQHTVQIWILLKIYGRFWSSDYENRQFFGKI